MLNCLFGSDNVMEYNVYNKNGSVNIINCLFTSLTDMVSVKSESVTNIVNSVLCGWADNVQRNVSLYGTAYQLIDESVTADGLSRSFNTAEFFGVGFWDLPVILTYIEMLYPIPVLRDGILSGYYTGVKGGVLQLSKDKEAFTSIGVETSFTNEELALDMKGIERLSVFGPYSEIIRNFYLGDADNNGTIEIIDATVIQRCCVKMDVPYSIETLMQGDVDENGELNIIDATWIQRYLLMHSVKYSVGELKIKDDSVLNLL